MEKTDVRTLKSIHCTSVTWLQLHRQITPPPSQKKSFPHWGGGVKILFNRLSYSIYFKLVEASLTWYTSIYFKFFPLISLTWSVLMDLHYTGRERASSGRLCLCLQRLSRPPHCRAIIISPLSISDPMGQVAYGFPRYLILNEWLYLNGTQPNTYSDKSCVCKLQMSTFCVQIENSLRLVGHLQWLLVPIRVVLIKLIL